NGEPRIAAATGTILPAFRRIGNEEVGFGERIRVLKKLTYLAVSIGANQRCFSNGRDKLGASIFLAAFGRINHTQLAGLGGVMTAKDREHFLRAGDATRMSDG